MDIIKSELKYFPTVILQIDYANKGFSKIIKDDYRKYNIGMIMLTQEIFKNKEETKLVLELKIPILTWKENLKSVKEQLIFEKISEDEQISPIVFDISSQLKK